MGDKVISIDLNGLIELFSYILLSLGKRIGR